MRALSIRSQLLKGILDGCVLAIIEKEEIYGYELSQKLQHYGLKDISEGTIYPVLLRLQKVIGLSEQCVLLIAGQIENTIL